MTAWRVTYLPEPTAESRRPVTVTVEDRESASFEAFVSRLSSGALGAEWTQGRVVRGVVEFDPGESRRGTRVVTVVITAAVVGIVVIALVLLAFVPSGPLYQHPWSATMFTGAVCATGCFSQPITENFPNGSSVTGTWSAPQPAVLFIHLTSGNICPGGNPSSFGPDGSCSEPGVTFGEFNFTAPGGPVGFTVGSQTPQNVTLSGDWSVWP